jgi:hypothetical protein
VGQEIGLGVGFEEGDLLEVGGAPGGGEAVALLGEAAPRGGEAEEPAMLETHATEALLDYRVGAWRARFVGSVR